MKIDEFIEVFKEQKYRHLGLFTKHDKCIIKFNTVKMKPESRLKQICTRLKSPTLLDDYYIIKGKSYHGDLQTDDYLINVNDNKMETNIITPPIHTPEVTGYSFEKSLDLEVKCKHLEIEVDRANSELEALKKVVEELEEEETTLNEGPPNWQTFLSETLTTVAPMIDKYFELKERKIKIDENRAIPNKLSNEMDPKVNNDENQELIGNINDLLINHIEACTDIDKKEKLITTYNESNTFDDLITNINNIDSALLENVMSQVNNR